VYHDLKFPLSKVCGCATFKSVWTRKIHLIFFPVAKVGSYLKSIFKYNFSKLCPLPVCWLCKSFW